MLGLQAQALLALGELDLPAQGLHLSRDLLGRILPVCDGGVRIEDQIRFARSAEVRLQPVVVDLADRVEHVVVAARAANGQAEQRRPDDVGPLGEDFVAARGHLLVASVAADWPEAVESRRGEKFPVRLRPRPVRGHLVAGKLLRDEAVQRLVAVERLDHIVAIAPQSGQVAVVFEPLGFRESHHVQPALSCALAPARAGHQAVHQSLPRSGRAVAGECLQLCRSGGQSGGVKVSPPG